MNVDMHVCTLNKNIKATLKSRKYSTYWLSSGLMSTVAICSPYDGPSHLHPCDRHTLLVSSLKELDHFHMEDLWSAMVAAPVWRSKTQTGLNWILIFLYRLDLNGLNFETFSPLCLSFGCSLMIKPLTHKPNCADLTDTTSTQSYRSTLIQSGGRYTCMEPPSHCAMQTVVLAATIWFRKTTAVQIGADRHAGYTVICHMFPRTLKFFI